MFISNLAFGKYGIIKAGIVYSGVFFFLLVCRFLGVRVYVCFRSSVCVCVIVCLYFAVCVCVCVWAWAWAWWLYPGGEGLGLGGVVVGLPVAG